MFTKTSQILKQSALCSTAIILAVASLQFALLNQKAYAAQITSRSLTLSSTSPESANATTSYSFDFTVPTTGVAIQSFDVEICTTASGACTTPTGFSSGSATVGSTTNLDDGNAVIDNSDVGILAVNNTGNATTPSNPVNVTFDNVQNPTTANQTFFARMTTYSDDAYSTPIDSGTVASSTTEPIDLTGVVDETIVFCTGTSITGTNCGTVSGSTVDFGTFSSATPSSGTSVMAASTNAVSGYAITINGSTLTCTTCSGTPTIAALGSQTASSPGTAQFGANLRNNATPNVGSDPSGSGSGNYTANYGTTDQFRFVSGDDVASSGAATDANAFTVSYLVNIPGSQPAGTYTATMTFIATATF